MSKELDKTLSYFNAQFDADARIVFGVLQREAYRIAKEKGFHDQPRPFAVAVALMHSELSEALEADRYGSLPSEKIPDFTGVEEELADLLIRVFDEAESRNLRLVDATMAKMCYNRTRTRMHGGKAY